MKKEKNNLIKEYEKKIKLVKKYNRQYYEKDSPSIPDSEYDKIKERLSYIFLLKKTDPIISTFKQSYLK